MLCIDSDKLSAGTYYFASSQTKPSWKYITHKFTQTYETERVLSIGIHILFFGNNSCVFATERQREREISVANANAEKWCTFWLVRSVCGLRALCEVKVILTVSEINLCLAFPESAARTHISTTPHSTISAVSCLPGLARDTNNHEE